jgi:hypothetical protein
VSAADFHITTFWWDCNIYFHVNSPQTTEHAELGRERTSGNSCIPVILRSSKKGKTLTLAEHPQT